MTVPRPPPVRLVNRLSTSLLNEVWFRATILQHEKFQSACAYFHPLDAIAGWNALYGRSGFVQYQFAVPGDRGDVITDAVASIIDARVASVLSVLKRFGPGTPGPLSFPIAGSTSPSTSRSARPNSQPFWIDWTISWPKQEEGCTWPRTRG